MARRYSLGLVALAFSGFCLVGCAAPRSSQDTESRLQSLENKVASFSDLRARVDALENATRAKGILEPALNTENLPPPEQESKTPPHSDYVVSTLPGQKEVTKAPPAPQATGSNTAVKSSAQAETKPVAQAEVKPQTAQSGASSPFAKTGGTPPPVIHVTERGKTSGQPPLPKLDGEPKPQAEGDLRPPQVQAQAEQPKAQPKEQPKPEVRAQEKPSPAPKTEKGAYEAALALQDAGKYGESRKAMASFLESYPSSVYVPNALYWTGESHYSQSQWEQAILSFKDVVSRFPKHAKAADALLKLGMCYEKLKDKDNARFHYEALLEDFPGSGAAKLAKARLTAL